MKFWQRVSVLKSEIKASATVNNNDNKGHLSPLSCQQCCFKHTYSPKAQLYWKIRKREKYTFLCPKNAGRLQSWQRMTPRSFCWLSSDLRMWVQNWEHHNDHCVTKSGWESRISKFILLPHCSLGIWLSCMHLSDPGTDFKFAAVLLSDFAFLSKSCPCFSW